MEQLDKQMEINLLDLLYYLKKKILIIIAVTVICAIAGFLYSSLLVTPMYTAETRMYVLNRSSSAGVVGSDFQIADNILADYKILITGKNVTQEVINQLGLKEMTPASLSAKIKVTAPEDTRVVQITVTDSNPQRAADIANKVREVATKQIQEIMDVEAIQVVYGADVPAGPSSPNVKRRTVLIALLGLFLSGGVFVVIFVMDDTIRNEEDVERYLGLSVLGVIPCTIESDDEAAGKKKKLGAGRKATKK